MKFLVCEKMQDEGCDYTIGCGMTFYYIDADNIQEAKYKVLWPNGKGENDVLCGEFARCEILIIPAEHVYEVHLRSIVAKIEEEEKIKKYKENERKESELYEKLKGKYGE